MCNMGWELGTKDRHLVQSHEFGSIRGQSVCKYLTAHKTEEEPASVPEFSSHETSWEEQGGNGVGVIQAAISHLSWIWGFRLALAYPLISSLKQTSPCICALHRHTSLIVPLLQVFGYTFSFPDYKVFKWKDYSPKCQYSDIDLEDMSVKWWKL